MEVYGQLVLFEPDEERNYRAVIDKEQLEKGAKVEVELLQTIAQVLESVVK